MMLWVYPPKVLKPPEPKRLSEAQKAEIKSIFVLYDLNDNGLLDKKELLEALADTGYDDDEIEEMFEEYDTNGDGVDRTPHAGAGSRDHQNSRSMSKLAIICRLETPSGDEQLSQQPKEHRVRFL